MAASPVSGARASGRKRSSSRVLSSMAASLAAASLLGQQTTHAYMTVRQEAATALGVVIAKAVACQALHRPVKSAPLPTRLIQADV